MHFDTNLIYHVYNQGNNRIKIFYTDENYRFFLGKVRKHIVPHADVISYCLMPNHFHFQIKPKESAILSAPILAASKGIIKNNLTHQIGILLSSYTRAINKQESRSGSLFRGGTKYKHGWIDEVLSAGKPQFGVGNEYDVTCLNYIHQNPVKARLVKKSVDWEYSSARDYAGLRNGTFCNLEIGKKLLEQ